MEDNRGVYTNIQNSLFAKIKPVPSTPDRMHNFIYAHRGVNFLDDDLLEHFENHMNATVVQLDAFFCLLSATNRCFHELSEEICQTAESSLTILDNCLRELRHLITNKDFTRSLSFHLLSELSYPLEFGRFYTSLTQRLNKTLESSLYFMNDEKTVLAIREYTVSNRNKIELYIGAIYDVVKNRLDSLMIIAKDILALCLVQNLDTSGKNILEMFVANNKNLVIDKSNDQVMEQYIELINEETPVDNFDFNGLTKFFNEDESQTDLVQKLAQINFYPIKPLDSWNQNIFDCFVQQGFAKNRAEIGMLVSHILSTERDTVGYSNKYDGMTLQDHYMLISMANDITISYDTFIKQVYDGHLVPNYPVEFVIRVLSRLYNVQIIFYTDIRTQIYIDNAIELNPSIIFIYQHSYAFLYNIAPIGSDFVPATNSMSKIHQSRKSHKPHKQPIVI